MQPAEDNIACRNGIYEMRVLRQTLRGRAKTEGKVMGVEKGV